MVLTIQTEENQFRYGGLSMELDNIKKHCERLVKQIDIHIGKGKGKEILSDLYEVTGNETPQECACVKTNKYSAYNKRYFQELRDNNMDETNYLKAVAEFLSGRPRIGKKSRVCRGENHHLYGKRKLLWLFCG